MSSDCQDARVQSTLTAVDWDMLSARACQFHDTKSAKWCSLISGGFNLIRFLQLDGDSSTTIVARVPFIPVGGWDGAQSLDISRRISSEVATMRYVEARTRIPVPRVLDYSAVSDGGGVGSPYILMTKVDGVPLSTLWDGMEDEKREVVLRQVVDILLELSSHRFDKIGSLMQLEDQDSWTINRLVCFDDLNENIIRAISAAPFTSGTDYWLAYANARLRAIRDDQFGSRSKMFEYTFVWFMRSLIPALYDPSLDEAGFPLCPGDFHSQNIMVTDVDSTPRISAVIDWEFSSTHTTSSFAQYPLFIIDHPHWDEDDPLRVRNTQDRLTFDILFREAESKASQTGVLRLAPAFASSQGIYLFEQLMQCPLFFGLLQSKLFDYVYGPGAATTFSLEYYPALMDNGLLKEVTKEFEWEAEVFKEARQVIGEELISGPLSGAAFAAIAQARLSEFEATGSVRQWLANRT